MYYTLRRLSDNAGDRGGMSLAVLLNDAGDVQFEEDARPRVGVLMRVGSDYGRAYFAQDFWQTTKIVEILEETDNTVRFRTQNSEYEWRITQ